MIVKLILSALLLYYIGVLWKYYRHDIAGLLGKTDAEEAADEPDEEAEQPDEPYTVIGKSTYRNGQTDEPDDKQGHADNQVDKTDNFAPGTPESEPEATTGEAENKPETATGNPADNGTEEAGETATADDDADYSDIEPEEDEEEEEYVPTPEELKEMEEEEELGAYYPDGNPDFATGYTFEDLKKVHRIMTTDEADEREIQQAREVLPAVMGSDVWDEMLDEFEGARQRVARLMNNHNV